MIILMAVRLTATWNSSPMMVAISGVATLKVWLYPQQSEHRQQVNDATCPAIGVLAQNRAAGFRVFLAGSFSYVQHKAECYRQHQIEAPRDKAPMEQGIYPCPVLNAAHLCQMGVGCIQHPFRKRVKQDIRSKTASKHHGAPCKEGILRLFVGSPRTISPYFEHAMYSDRMKIPSPITR